MSSGAKVIEPKFLEYEFIETVLLRLDAYYSQGGTLGTNNRAYFDPNSIIPGRRVIGIELYQPGGTILYEGVEILNTQGAFARFTLTMVKGDSDEEVKDLPIIDLARIGNFGNTRVFNIIPNIEKCYILNTGTPIPQANRGLLFNFYTVSW